MNETTRKTVEAAMATFGADGYVVVGDWANVYSQSEIDKVRRDVWKQLRDGGIAEWSDGHEEKIVYNHESGPGDAGSERYVWDETGNKVAATRIRYTRQNQNADWVIVDCRRVWLSI